MKILHILNEITFSGAEVMLKDAAPIFLKNGFDLHVLSTGDEIGKYAETLRRSCYTVYHIPFRRSPRYFIELYRFLRKEKFDLVHIHPERAFFWHAIMVWLLGANRIIRSVLDVFLFTGYLRLKRKYQRLIARKIFKVTYIAISDSVMEIESQYFQNPTVIVKNWIDESYFRPPTEAERLNARKQFSFKENDTVLISVGTCNKKKNHYAVFDVLSELNRSLETPLKYLHRGTGPTTEDEKEYARRIGVQSCATFVGYLDDLRVVYWASDIFVMTSGWEGLGSVILEAMYCGLPVILYNVLGMRDTLPEGKGGILVEPNPDALEKAIKQLALSGELRKRMGIEARESVSRNFNGQESLERLLKLYRGERVV